MPAWCDIAIDRFSEETGTLAVLEYPGTLPFIVKRIFWLSNVALDAVRGGHAHEDLQQVLFCGKGSCIIQLTNRIGNTESITLHENDDGLYLEGAVWRTMLNFTPDCCLMVLCDRPYNEDRVIRSFDEFLALP